MIYVGIGTLVHCCHFFHITFDVSPSYTHQCYCQVDMFSQRYALIQQRILRQDIFQAKLVTASHGRSNQGHGGGTHTLTPVESLLGRSGVRYLLGMIVQVSCGLALCIIEKRYFLRKYTHTW